jgi:hypothetical protein
VHSVMMWYVFYWFGTSCICIHNYCYKQDKVKGYNLQRVYRISIQLLFHNILLKTGFSIMKAKKFCACLENLFLKTANRKYLLLHATLQVKDKCSVHLCIYVNSFQFWILPCICISVLKILYFNQIILN